MADERPPVYREGDVWVMRASSFGFCSTRLARHAAGMQGAPTPQSIIDAWEFGSAAEPEILRRVEAEGWRLLKPGEMRKWGKVDRTGQLSLELKVGKKAVVRCHPDGIVENIESGELRVLEAKTRAKGSDPEAFVPYQWQTSIESAVTRLPVLMAVGWKIPGKDPDGNTTEIRVLEDGVELREFDPMHGVGKIKARALMLARMFDQAESEGRWDGDCDANDYPCPFYVLCKGDGGKKDAYVEVEEGRVGLVERLVGEYQDAKGREKAAKAEADEVKKELVDVLDEGKWKAGGWKVAVSVSEIPEAVKTVKAHKRTNVTIKEST